MPYSDVMEQRAYQRERLRKRRVKWLKENGPCRVCGSWENPEVDHIDPTTKVTHSVWSWSEARRLVELAKCQVLCKKHHLIKTSSERHNAKATVHGKLWTYQKGGCRCSECVAAKMEEKARNGWS